MKNKAFSLVEMSIVLVIISLIIAGLISGQSLLQASKVVTTISEVNEYREAIRSFQDKYLGLPGDLINAADYFPDCVNIGGNNPCNGDGNGLIETDTTIKECTRAWQHLSFSGLIKGDYDGTFPDPLVLGTNLPSGKADSSGYWLCNEGTTTADNLVYFGIRDGSNDMKAAVLSPPEAENIDKKIDDGNSNTGNVVGVDGTNVTQYDCVTNASPNYNLANDQTACAMHFALD